MIEQPLHSSLYLEFSWCLINLYTSFLFAILITISYYYKQIQLTELPQGVLTILNGIFTNDVHTVFYMNLANLLDLLSLINCYVGFIAYCFLCTKYQQTFAVMIFTWLELLIVYVDKNFNKILLFILIYIKPS